MLYLVRVGKEWASPVFSHPLKAKSCLHIHDRVRLIPSLVGVGKEWAGQVFLHPDNHLQLDALSCEGGERMGPVFPHPLKRKGCLRIHDRVRLMLSLVRVGKEWVSPDFLHPDNHLYKVDALSCQGGERMGQPSFSSPPKK